MPEARLKNTGPRRLGIHGKKFERGAAAIPIDLDLALTLQNDPRFEVTGLTQADLAPPAPGEAPKTNKQRLEAIKVAADEVEPDDENFDAQGIPTGEAVSNVLGYDVTDAEVVQAITGKASVSRVPEVPEQVARKGMEQVERKTPAAKVTKPTAKTGTKDGTEPKPAAKPRTRSPAAKADPAKKAAAQPEVQKKGKLTITRKPPEQKSTESGDISAADLKPNQGGTPGLLDTGHDATPPVPAAAPKGPDTTTEDPVEV